MYVRHYMVMSVCYDGAVLIERRKFSDAFMMEPEKGVLYRYASALVRGWNVQGRRRYLYWLEKDGAPSVDEIKRLEWCDGPKHDWDLFEVNFKGWKETQTMPRHCFENCIIFNVCNDPYLGSIREFRQITCAI